MNPSDGRPEWTTRRRFLAAAGVAGAGFLAGCTGGIGPGGGSDGDGGDGPGAWQSTVLTDVLTDESFAIADLEAPVVVQAFAVWCSNCRQQSRQLAKVDAGVTRVGLNMDPNEDATKVRRHADEHGWDWRFAVAPTEMSKALVDEFGTTVTNAPSTPLIVVCADGSTTFDAGQIRSASKVASLADEC